MHQEAMATTTTTPTLHSTTEAPPLQARLQHHQRPVDKDPFAVPVFIHLLAQHLDDKSIVTCLRVSKQFYIAFLPRVWSEVKLSFASSRKWWDGPVFDHGHVFTRHAPLVHKLKLYVGRSCNFPQTNLPIHCPNLRTIVISSSTMDGFMSMGPNKTSEAAYRNSLTELVKRHRTTLQEIDFDSSVSEKLLKALADCPRLRKIRNAFFDLDCTPEQWMAHHSQLFSHTEYLALQGWDTTCKKSVTLTEAWSKRKTLPRTNVKEFKLETTKLQQRLQVVPLLIIMTSPDLVHLEWIAHEDKFSKSAGMGPIQMLAKAAKAKALDCPRLESLSIPGFKYYSKDELKIVLEVLPALKKLDMTNTNFESGYIEMIKNELPRLLTDLKELNLENNWSVSAPDILEIMSNFSGLEVLRASTALEDKDLEKDQRPWACRGLKKLIVGFDRTKGATSDAMILSRIATLEQLEVLDVSAAHSHAEWVLRLKLEHGLDQLKTLKQLKHLRGPDDKGNGFRWGLAEAQWATENWKSLKTLQNISLDGEAKMHIKERGIAHVMPQIWINGVKEEY
ncbi:hypothetical protein BGZ83_010076 [Gryganskiella cystojenkinii]|nr:hypothetical protein BGZ83_010076 [Gryganskiella cystojenkinii]